MGLQATDAGEPAIKTDSLTNVITRPMGKVLQRLADKVIPRARIKEEALPSQTEILREKLVQLIADYRAEHSLKVSQPIEWEDFNAFVQADPKRQTAFDEAVEGLWPLYMTPEYKDQVYVATALELRQSTIRLLELTIEDVVARNPQLKTCTLGLLSGNLTEIRGNADVNLRGIIDVLEAAARKYGKQFNVVVTCYSKAEQEALAALAQEKHDGVSFEILARPFDIRESLPKEVQKAHILMATLVLSYLPRKEQVRIHKGWQKVLDHDVEVILGVPVAVGTVGKLQDIFSEGVLQVRPQGPLERIVERVVAKPLRAEGEVPLSIEKARTGVKGVIAKIFMVAKLLQITQGDMIRFPRNIKRLLNYVEKAADPLARISEPLLTVGAHYNWTSALVTELQQMGVRFKSVTGSIGAYDATYSWIATRLQLG